MPMTATIPLSATDIAMLRDYEADVVAAYTAIFQAAGARLVNGSRLLARFTDAMAVVHKRGRMHFRGADEAHNELAVAAALLAEPAVATVAYEPPLAGTDQTIDFVVTDHSGTLSYIDVKAVRPRLRDRWDQFERVTRDGLIPENVNIVLTRDWMGGELWHGSYA